MSWLLAVSAPDTFAAPLVDFDGAVRAGDEGAFEEAPRPLLSSIWFVGDVNVSTLDKSNERLAKPLFSSFLYLSLPPSTNCFPKRIRYVA